MLAPDVLSAYITSRICHDLVSPVSSINNAIDFIDDKTAADMHGQANTLLRDGAEKAAHKIEFLRFALGSLGLSKGMADIHQAKKITNDYTSSYRPDFNWEIPVTQSFSYGQARLMMNMVMMGISAMAKGTLSCQMKSEAGGLTLNLLGEGRMSNISQDIDRILKGQEPIEGWSARNVQPYFASLVAKSLGADLSLSIRDNGFVIMAVGAKT